MTQNKKKLQNQIFSPINQSGDKKENNDYKSEQIEGAQKIDSVIKKLETENLEEKGKIFNNIHTIPADEQQLENKTSDFVATKK